MSERFPLGHQMILASAGSGKTHDLTTRFLTLMAAGVEPERIIALTFSRKSAGEFFGRILSRLADAAGSEASAAELERAIQEQEAQHLKHLGVKAGVGEESPGPAHRTAMTKDAANELLVKLVRNLHLLTLGTMDSFFIRMARAFPLELGLGGDFTILDGQLETAARQRIYTRLFHPSRNDAADQEDFIQAFQQATHGKEENSLLKNLNDYVTKWNGLFAEARPTLKWGQPRTIWPLGDGPKNPGVSLKEAVAEARELLESGRYSFLPGQLEVLMKFLTEMAELPAFGSLGSTASGVLKKLAELGDELETGSAEIMLNRKNVKLDPVLGAALGKIVKAMVFDEFTAGCQQAQGIWRLLHRYETHYDAMVRRQGKLTFSDVQMLLSGELEEDKEEFQINRELLDFRLDSRFDHWMLDEFQDTNGRQWHILESLIREVLQDEGGERTFFAVGDVKQAIHMWRGSDPDLVDRLLRQYNQGTQQTIALLSKAVSWRCSPAVLALPNRLLGHREVLAGELPPNTLGTEWEFQTHEAAGKNSKLSGVSEVLLVESAKGEGVQDQMEVMLERMREIQPLSRGLTCSVLVMTNKQVEAVADAIRAATGWLVTAESDTSIVALDPAASGLLELFRLAAHPANKLAREHLKMSPWAAVAAIVFPDVNWPVELAAGKVRQQVVQDGLAQTVKFWTKQLLAHLPELPAYSQARLNELMAVAVEVDETGSKDLDEFVMLAQEKKVRGTSAHSSIQVMTIFKAKGLEWDVVFLTGLDDSMHGGKFSSTGVAYDDQRKVSWVTKIPKKDIALQDPVMQQMDEARTAWRWRQNVCLLYVALTRAKRATHVILPFAEGSKAKRLDTLIARLLEDQPAGALKVGEAKARRVWLEGNAKWHEAVPLKPAVEAVSKVTVQSKLAAPAKLRLQHRKPSEHEMQHFFSLERRQAMQLGEAVHAALANLSWLGTDKNFSNLAADPDVRRVLQLSLSQPAVKAVFTKPEDEGVEIWLERAFDIVIKDTHVSGVFDRVELRRNNNGSVESAVIYDFKSDTVKTQAQIKALVKTYRPQLHEYRAALAILLGLPQDRIATKLVMLSLGRVEEV